MPYLYQLSLVKISYNSNHKWKFLKLKSNISPLKQHKKWISTDVFKSLKYWSSNIEEMLYWKRTLNIWLLQINNTIVISISSTCIAYSFNNCYSQKGFRTSTKYLEAQVELIVPNSNIRWNNICRKSLYFWRWTDE